MRRGGSPSGGHPGAKVDEEPGAPYRQVSAPGSRRSLDRVPLMAAEDVAPDDTPPRPRSPLHRREFKLYFTGNLVSNVGNWLNNVALAVYMRHITHSSFWVGVATFGLLIPSIVFALPAGVLADRVDRIQLLRRSQWVMGTLAIVLTMLVGAGEANRYVVTLIAIGLGIGVALAIPGVAIAIPGVALAISEIAAGAIIPVEALRTVAEIPARRTIVVAVALAGVGLAPTRIRLLAKRPRTVGLSGIGTPLAVVLPSKPALGELLFRPPRRPGAAFTAERPVTPAAGIVVFVVIAGHEWSLRCR